MGDGRAALGAEESVDLVSGGGRARPRLDGAVDGQLVFRDDGDESWSGFESATLLETSIRQFPKRRGSIRIQ